MPQTMLLWNDNVCEYLNFHFAFFPANEFHNFSKKEIERIINFNFCCL